MYKSLLLLSWKEFWRSFSLAKNLLTGIMKGFMALYFSAILISIGFFFPAIAEKIWPSLTVIEVLNHGLVYYLILDFFIRVLLLGGTKLDIEKLLQLPIKKNRIAHFFLFRSLFKVNNFLPVLFGLPFLFSYLGPAMGWTYAISWFLMVCLLALAVHFLSIFFSRQQFKRPLIAVTGLVLLAVLLWLDWNSGFELLHPFAAVFDWLAANGTGPLLGIVLVAVGAWISYDFLLKNMYLSNAQTKSSLPGDGFRISWFSGYGTVGHLVNLDFQMIFRNKRPRTNVIALVFMVPLFLFQIQSGEDSTFSVGWGALLIFIFLTGMLQVNINQLFYAWDGSYFDFILTNKIRLKDYLASKFYTSLVLTVFSIFLLAPVFWWFPSFFPYFLVGLLYNAGFLPFVYLFLSTYNRTAIDLRKGAWFNYEGTGFIQYLIVLPVMGPAFLVYLPFYLLGYEMIGLGLVLGMGLAGLVFFKPLLKLVERQFLKQKYKLAAAFRNQ